MVLTTVISAISKDYQVKHLLPKILLMVDADHNHHTRGFTLVELIVIMAIIAVLATITTLSLPAWRDNITLRTTTRDLVSHMQFAKIEAAKRNATASIELTEGGGGVGKCAVVMSGQTLREMTMPAKVSLTATPVTTFQINNRGIPVGGGGTVTLTNGDRTYNITLSAAGAISMGGP
jgi:prepilin-type N-terminal cleavage/methylation domain-containing protein